LTEPALTEPAVTEDTATRAAAPELLSGGWPAPAPGAALLPRMVRGQAALELRTLMRNGEQLVLTLIIPVLLLLAFGHENFFSIGSGIPRIDFVVPGILALAVLSTAFTGQAIGTGFERRYGVLKRLGATPLSRRGLIAAKTLTVLTVELGQFTIVMIIGTLLDWRPVASPAAAAWVPLLLLAGTAAFSGIALLMAGTLRAEATLAGANLLYLILLGLGGILFPLTKFPAAARPVLKLLPAGALSDGLRATLAHSSGLPVRDLLVLCAWAIVAIALAVRTFRWE
jgi:ABC-2 type transport system permease protein